LVEIPALLTGKNLAKSLQDFKRVWNCKGTHLEKTIMLYGFIFFIGAKSANLGDMNFKNFAPIKIFRHKTLMRINPTY
jgi:hypothetical protein